MKTLLITFFIAISYFCSAQSTEKFIRIVGNSSAEYQNNGVLISIEISEILPNEYKQITYKSIEDVYTEFITKISTIGINENSLMKVIKSFGKGYSKTMSQSYELSTNLETMIKLRSLDFEGISFNDIKYTFPKIGMDGEEDLALNAINDAKRKANFLAEKNGFKVGKILNIEDFSSGCCHEIAPKPDAQVRLVYRVNVTFELLAQ